MILGMLQYINTLKTIKQTRDISIIRYPMIVAIFLCILGVFLFVNIIFKIW